MNKLVWCAALALALFLSPAQEAHAAFGIKPGSLKVSAENGDGGIDSQAGSHPAAFNLEFKLNETPSGLVEGGSVRDVIVDLPPGMFADPQAVPTCPRQKFEGALPTCPPSTQVGVARANLPNATEAIGAVFNLQPPPGVPVQFGVSLVEQAVLESASLRPEAGYQARVSALNIPIEATSISTTIWGLPADPSHDSQRGQLAAEGRGGPLPSEAPAVPLLTLPASCETPPQVRVQVDSQLAPGAFVTETASFPDEGGLPAALAGCQSVPFTPIGKASPTSSSAETSSGLGFQLQLPNQGLLNPKDGAVTETEPERMEVVLPQGVTANPSAAQGLVGCSPAQIGLKTATGESPASFNEALPSCPESSKLGTLTASTPLLEEGLEGSVYLATPHDNPFNSLLALYVVARAPERGVLIKLAAEASIDPATGQITTTIDGMPPIPYSSVYLRLREGPRAPLITPDVCGQYQAVARLYPFSDPDTATVKTMPFTISSGAEGGACAASASQLPFSPALQAGTTNPFAGAFTPFEFRVSRKDGEQRFSSINATLPEGLTGKLAGIPYCPESGIAQAQARGQEGEGALELASPSCPAASQVGVVNVAAGAGPQPYTVQGKAYLAGPYKGAPLSLAIVTPAVAGPFDLGVVVVRAGLYVDETTARISVKSDPLPTILHGIPLDVRSVSVQVNREGFMLNPTNCEAMAVGGEAVSVAGSTIQLSNRFAVGGCAGLGFNPTLKLTFKGGTTRTRHPSLSTLLTFPSKGSFANVAKAAVTLPHSEIIDPEHVGNPCTRPQFAEEKCPKISVLGRAKAWSPLLEAPLEGKVYFRSNGGERALPDVVADLRGQVHLVLIGAVDTVTPKTSARIRTTFFQVPDAPVSKFELQLKGGKEGLLVNSENLCHSKQRAVVRLVAQNGRVKETQPTIANGCGKKGKRQ